MEQLKNNSVIIYPVYNISAVVIPKYMIVITVGVVTFCI